MRIAHFSDIHWSEQNSDDIEVVVRAAVEDANAEGWAEEWTALIKQKTATRFEIENLIARLHEAVSIKALDSDQSKRFSTVADELEKRFDWSGQQANKFRESLNQTRNIERLKDNAGKV